MISDQYFKSTSERQGLLQREFTLLGRKSIKPRLVEETVYSKTSSPQDRLNCEHVGLAPNVDQGDVRELSLI